MKKFIKWGGITVLVLIVLSAIFSGEEAEESIDIPASRNLKIEAGQTYGDFGDMISVVGQSSTLKYKDQKILLKVRLKLEKPLPSGYKIDDMPYLTLLNDDGENTLDYNSLSLSDNEESKFITFLKSTPGSEEDFLFKEIYCRESLALNAMTTTTGIHIDHLSLISLKEAAALEREEAREEAAKAAEEEETEEEASSRKKNKPLTDDEEFNQMLDATEKTFDLLKKEAELINKLQNR